MSQTILNATSQKSQKSQNKFMIELNMPKIEQCTLNSVFSIHLYKTVLFLPHEFGFFEKIKMLFLFSKNA